LFKEIPNKTGKWRGADPPADDLLGIGCDHERDMDKPLSDCDRGEI
jgi:hypothetical protein